MRLYLAVAVVMLAFVAYTEAQDDRLTEFTTKLQESYQRATENVKTAFENFQKTETANNIRTYFSDLWAKTTEAVQQLGSK